MYKRYVLIKPACSKGCAVGRVFEAVQKQYFQDEQKICSNAKFAKKK